MRHTALALVLALLAAFGSFLPRPEVVSPTSAATANPKVVIIVGATGDATATYRTRADVAYAEAIKYTSNVVKVYSPYATWAAVKAAIQGASIVMYMGHGNGFPSPYRTAISLLTNDGFGLNAAAGQGDYNTVYYGEQYIANEISLAPNAVVLLHHLCYASGNSEPGKTEPTLDIAKQRADNYAAGFLRAGAQAVIADGLYGPAYYIRALFTTRQTADELWRAAPNFHNNAFSFPSVRTPGYTVEMDPNLPGSGFYRALTGRLNLSTIEVTGASYAATDVDPASFTVPGNAAVVTPNAGLFADPELTPNPSTGLAPATLPAGTRLRLVAAGQTSLGVPTLQVQGIDATASGWMATADLAPRDSSPPQAWQISTGTGAFSPNGDGSQDTLTLTARLSESAWWRVRFWRDGVLWWSGSSTGTAVSATWNGKKDTATAPDGAYRWTIETSDSWGNVGPVREGTVVIDTVAPSLASISLAADTTPTFSPNGDGRSDTVAIGWQTSEPGVVDVSIRNAAAATVRSIASSTATGAGSTAWDGRSSAGTVVPDGTYTARIVPRDAAGNVGQGQDRQVAVYAALGYVAAAPVRFYAQDEDRLARFTTLSFVLKSAATVTWQITKSNGTVIRTIYNNTPLPAGTYSVKWYATDQAGVRVPAGTYVSRVQATNGTLQSTLTRTVETNAFSISSSLATAVRGKLITITGISAESLTGYVYLRVQQPGITAWSVRMTKVGTLTWRATVRMKPSAAGKVTFRISARDVDGRFQATYRTLALQ